MIRSRRTFLGVCLLLVLGLLAISLQTPRCEMPVKGATQRDWDADSHWYYPWGRSRVHLGIDIFADEGTEVVASTKGLVVYSGDFGAGGNVVAILDPGIRLHYFAHLKYIRARHFRTVQEGETIGAVGNTGNAAGKKPHLHYSILPCFPAGGGSIGHPRDGRRLSTSTRPDVSRFLQHEKRRCRPLRGTKPCCHRTFHHLRS